MIFKNYYCNLFVFIIVYIVHTFGESQTESNINKIQAPLSKCTERKNCTSCIQNDINLQCYWCDNQCSSITYLQKGCKNMKLNPEYICASDFTVGNSSIKTYDKHGSSNKSTSWSDSDYFLIEFCVGTIIIIICTLLIFYYVLEQFGETPMQLRPLH